MFEFLSFVSGRMMNNECSMTNIVSKLDRNSDKACLLSKSYQIELGGFVVARRLNRPPAIYHQVDSHGMPL